jgi:LacI family transcriptional regulator
MEEMARAAVEMLIGPARDQAEGEPQPSVNRVLPHELLVRNSTSALHGKGKRKT